MAIFPTCVLGNFVVQKLKKKKKTTRQRTLKMDANFIVHRKQDTNV